jgi:Sulfotransferase family
MQLSHSHRFIFVHIFKTAGTSMRAVLEPYTYRPGIRLVNRLRGWRGTPLPEPFPQLSGHARASQIRDAVPMDVFENYFKFAFVRNPWDWQVSWYHYILQNADHHEHPAVRRLGSFEEFLRWRIDHPVWKQKDFVVDEQGKEIVDFVGRFETIEEDFAHVCAATDVRARLPHLNRSNHKDYRTYYSDRACALLDDYSKDDIEYFAYRFDTVEEPVVLPFARPMADSFAFKKRVA